MAKRLPLRLVLEFKGTARKLCMLYVGSDNSFYVHSHRPPGTRWRVPGGTGRTEDSGRIRLDLENFILPPFNLHKISYHPSGVIHLTDSDGKRYRDGIRGPAFSEMRLPYDFCILAPCNPDFLPEHTLERGFIARIALPAEILPFYVTLTMIDAVAPPPPSQGPLCVQPLNFLFPGCPLGIALTMWPVKRATQEVIPVWPRFPFFLYRLAA